jgi:hypothetical protein
VLAMGGSCIIFKVMNVFFVCIIKCCFTLKVEVMFVHLKFCLDPKP